VLKERLAAEYGLPVDFDPCQFSVCRWIASDDPQKLSSFIAAHGSSMASDLDGAPVYMASSAFSLRYEEERAPGIVFASVKDYQRAAA
jgi:peptide chain release factor 3